MNGPKITINSAPGTWVVRAGGAIIGESSNAVELHEGNYPAVVYFPREDIAMDFLDATALKTICPHKGEASYFSIASKNRDIENAVWCYESPKPDVARIQGFLAFDLRKTAVERV